MLPRNRSWPSLLKKIFLRTTCGGVAWLVCTGIIAIVVIILISFAQRLHREKPFDWNPAPESDIFEKIFHEPDAFLTNYKEMEKNFRVYVYPDKDLLRDTQGITDSELCFFKNLMDKSLKILTWVPDEAHLFFVPLSWHQIQNEGSSNDNMTAVVEDYVWRLSIDYPYWNRTQGADHIFLICHDDAATVTEAESLKNSILVLCSEIYYSGYVPHKDIALPLIRFPFTLHSGSSHDLVNRKTFAFLAGDQNSPMRSIIASAWGNDTKDIVQYNLLSKTEGNLTYRDQLLKSKYCICDGDSQVSRMCISDSIHYGCVPVILSNNYELPFNDILDWKQFSVIINEKNPSGIKYTLESINDEELGRLQKNTIGAQMHFQWTRPPAQEYDAFSMIMYELWMRRHSVRYWIR